MFWLEDLTINKISGLSAFKKIFRIHNMAPICLKKTLLTGEQFIFESMKKFWIIFSNFCFKILFVDRNTKSLGTLFYIPIFCA